MTIEVSGPVLPKNQEPNRDGSIPDPSPYGNEGGRNVTPQVDTGGMTQAQTDAFELLAQTFAQYGLGSLVGDIKAYILQGYSGDTVALLLRQTQAYKDRFPAMTALSEQKRAISERDYIAYEVHASQLETQYGIPKGMISDPQNISRLLTENVSGDDLTKRVTINRAMSMDAPPELKSTLRDYYGIDGDAATLAYYLEPDHSVSYLENLAATAKVGAAARRQSIAFGLEDAQLLAQRGVTEQDAAQGFAQVAALRGLVGAPGDQVNQGQLIDAAFGDAAATQAVQRAQKGRTAQFQGSGGAGASQGGVSGLGSSST